jgi:hypothetical protein
MRGNGMLKRAAQRLHKSTSARIKRRGLKQMLLEKQERLYGKLRKLRKSK